MGDLETADEPPPRRGEAPRSFLFHSTDIDFSRELCSRFYFPMQLAVAEPGHRFALDLDVIRLGPITAGYVSFGAPISLAVAELGAYQVNMPLAGSVVSRHSGTVMQATPQRGAVYRSQGPAHGLWTPDCRQLCIKLDRPALEAELESLLGRPVGRPIDLAPALDLTAGAGRSWAALVDLLRAEVDQQQGLIYHPLIAERLWQSVLAGLLVAVDHPYRAELSRPAAASRPRPVKRAVDAMESEPQRPFTTHQLAEIAGVSVRSLQEGFRRHVGLSPMAYLHQVRLRRAHEDLQQADPLSTTVAAVAHRWGFLHLGRFAGSYRAKYGVAPSVTLRRPT